MGGDYSRTSFDPLRDFIGVGIQQGHAITDDDLNNLGAIFERRMRATALDTFGERAVVPKETPIGFEIRLAPGPKLTIGRGRMYVDGWLVENHGAIGAGALRPAFDRARLDPDGDQTGVLDEMISTQPNDFIDFAAQPYLPRPPVLPATPGPHVAYLDVWKREVTAVKDARLLEPALGIDTATRWQTVWQVRLLADVGAGASCGAQLDEWDALIAPSPARLTTATMTVEDPADPCFIPPAAGYRGTENQYYRVEVHTGGALGAASFKYSRDNASVAARIESIEPGNRVRVRTIGRDSILRFEVGNWVEITDDRREFSGESGDMRRIVGISGTDEIELDAALSADLVPAAPDSTGARNSRMFRWDQRGKVRFADGSLHIDLDTTTDGLIPVPTGGKAVQLEAGITVSFTTAAAGGVLRPLDHWCFAARKEGAQIEMLDAAPPLGIHHHYARLAVLTFPSSVSDCRVFWPPAEECGCTVCVSAEGHNSGRYTIQDAIADLPAAGGTVCLGPGDFILGATPVVLASRSSVRLRGHGFGSELAYAGPGGAIRVRDSSDIRITDLAVTVASAATGAAGQDAFESAAVHIVNGIHVTVGRTRLRVASGQRGNDFGVALAGWVIDVTIEDNLIEAVTGIGSWGEVDVTGLETGTIVYDLRVADNLIGSPRIGVSLEGSVFHLGAVRIEANTIYAGDAGISATGVGLGVPGGGGELAAENWSATGLSISANTITFARGGSGIASGILDLRVLDNDIVAREDSRGDAIGACVRLVAGGMPLVPADAQIVGNRLGNVDGYAISIEASQASLLVKRNVMRDCEQGAVTVGPDVSIRSLSFDNNLIERVATRESPELRTAVTLSGVADARIVGNSVRGVGSAAAGSVICIGFRINGAPSVDLSHNLITDIGLGVQNALSVGVYIHGAILACAVTANHIVHSPDALTEDTGSWCAIAVQGSPVSGQAVNPSTHAAGPPAGTSFMAGGPAGAAFRSAASAGPAHFAMGNTIFALGTNRLWALAPVRETQIRIAGNLIGDTHKGSLLPLVLVGAAGGTCTFSDNQCALLAPGQAAVPVVAISVPRIVAANNVVRRQSDMDAMTLVGGSFGSKPTVTALGNITFGNIRVNGGNLPTPFAPLNILSN